MPFDRQSISKKLRFDVFKRDHFACQYCGATPPSVLLEIDHVIAVSAGGTNEIDNLATACFDCNRGKAAGDLQVLPKSTSDKAVALQERRAQLRAYNKVLQKEANESDRAIDSVEEIFSDRFPGYGFSPSFRVSIRRNFLPNLVEFQLRDAMSLACSRMDNKDRAIKYFCGVCWNWIRGANA